MSSALRITFKALLEGLAIARLGLVTQSTGACAAQAGDKFILAAALDNASKTVWEMPVGKGWMWPWTVSTASAQALTSGAIPFANLDYCRWFALYSQDPRGVSSTGYFMPSYADDLGIHPMDDTLGSYFAFYIGRAPEFTSSVVTVSTAYNADDIVYDDRTVANGGTGECFRCLSSYTTPGTDGLLTTDLANTAKWRVQPVYKNFQTPMELMAYGQWLQTVRKFEEGAAMTAEGMSDLSEEYIKIFRQQASFMPNPHYARGTWR